MTARAIVATALASLLTATLPAQQVVDEHARREAARHYRAGQEAMAAEKFDRAADEFPSSDEFSALMDRVRESLASAESTETRRSQGAFTIDWTSSARAAGACNTHSSSAIAGGRRYSAGHPRLPLEKRSDGCRTPRVASEGS